MTLEAFHIKGIVQFLFKWGSMRYLLMVSVLASVDGGRIDSDVEKLGPVLTRNIPRSKFVLHT